MLSGPVKVRVVLAGQTASGIRIVTDADAPGVNVPLDGLNETPLIPLLDALQFKLTLFDSELITVAIQFQPMFAVYEHVFRAVSNFLPIVQFQGAAMVFPWNVNVNVPLPHSLLGTEMVVCVDWPGASDPFDSLKVTPGMSLLTDQLSLL